MPLHFKQKLRVSGSHGTEQLVVMSLPSKSFFSLRDICSRVVWGRPEILQALLKADEPLWTYVQTTSLNVHSDFDSREERMNLSAPCFPNLARYHITWGLDKNVHWLAPSPDLVIQTLQHAS